MQIYSGTVENVTEEILQQWLLRDWLHAWEVRTQSGLVDVAVWQPATTANTGLSIMEGTLDDEAIRVEVDRQPFWTRCLLVAPNGDDGGILELQQWRAAAVQVTFYEFVTDLFADKLRAWLVKRYGCEVTHQQLPPEDAEKLRSVEAFITLRNTLKYQRTPVKTLAELHADKFGSYDTLNRKRNYLNRTYSLNLEW